MTVDPPDEMTVDASGRSGACEVSPQDTEATGTEEEEHLPLDVVFGILKNRRRRLVLRYLFEVSETSTLSELAEHIASVENDKPVRALSSSERKRVYVCLYQCHLPKMDDADIIDFENDRGTVELAEDTEEFTQYLDFDEEESERDWPLYYVSLATIGGIVFVAQRLIYPSNVLSGIIMGILVGLFINVALEHAFDRGILFPRSIRFRPTAKSE